MITQDFIIGMLTGGGIAIISMTLTAIFFLLTGK